MQPLRRKRGRPLGAVMRVRQEHESELSRRAWYYQTAIDRAWVTLVEAGLMGREPRERGERWPLAYRVLTQIGRWSRTGDEVLSLARQVMELRRQGWTTRELLWWLREQDHHPRPNPSEEA